MDKNEPLISVIIPTYNCGRYIKRAVDSIMQQTFNNFEIIIVDDGSDDNTKEMLADSLVKNNKIKYIFQINQGHAIARNRGVKEARGEFIAFLDADDYWDPRKLEKQLEVFNKNPAIDLVHSNVYVFNEGEENKPRLPGISIDYNKFTQDKLYKKLLFFQIDVRIQTIMLRKSIFEKIGDFDENLTRLGCEDREFNLRVFKECKTYFINDYLAYYMLRKDSESKNTKKMRAGRVYLIEKSIKDHKNKNDLRNRILSSLYLRLSRNYFAEKMYFNAIKIFFLSFFYDILNYKIYCFILRFLIPFKFIRLMLSTK